MAKTKINLQTISRSIQLLRCFDDEQELGISELAQRLGIAKSTVYGIVSTLENHSFLEQDSRTGRYRLGTEIFRLGTKVKSDLLNLVKPYMEKLVTDFSETVHLVVPDQCSILYIHKIESPHSMRICSRVGERLPLYCTAVGKAILAQMGEEEQAAVISATSFHPYTPYTIWDKNILLQELAKVKAAGFAVDREELEMGLTCAGSPGF
ncbi:MAG: IclR family transcriptional regulator [Negativicutes bacterium]